LIGYLNQNIIDFNLIKEAVTNLYTNQFSNNLIEKLLILKNTYADFNVSESIDKIIQMIEQDSTKSNDFITNQESLAERAELVA
jgi:hypothetical protein